MACGQTPSRYTGGRYSKTTRPLLRTPDPRATLAGLLATREPVYALAQVTVEAAPDYSIEDMAAKVLSALSARPDILETT